jgi:hypothetical protein
MWPMFGYLYSYPSRVSPINRISIPNIPCMVTYIATLLGLAQSIESQSLTVVLCYDASEIFSFSFSDHSNDVVDMWASI